MEEGISFDSVQCFSQGDVMGEKSYFDTLRPEAHDGFGVVLTEVFGVSVPADAGAGPG